jgi:Putative peptidoglycan binding domain
LIRDVALWEELYSIPIGNDNWGLKALQTMLAAVGFPPGDLDGKMGPETSEAVKSFQTGNGLAPDGRPGPATRKVLFAAYMDQLCGKDLRLDKKEDFLAGTDSQGKGDYQGCSEFNPKSIFSQRKADAFAKDSDHTDRNEQNASNRRVIGLLFRPGSRVLASRWPCPRVKEGVAGCRKRFWSDGEERRSRRLPEDDRTLAATHDTFACRFYDRLSNSSPCEEPLRLVPLIIRLIDDLDQPVAEVKYRLEVAEQQIDGSTVGGLLQQLIPDTVKTGKLVLTEKTFHRVDNRNVESATSENWSIDLLIGALDAPDRVSGAKARLENMGFFVQNSLDASVDSPMRRAVQRMQTFYDLKSTDGNLTAETVAKLKEKYGS